MPIDPTLYDKLIRYCSYRERCTQEVCQKMRQLDIDNTPGYLKELVEDDLLNEQRYATSFASGRFRMKYWGKMKIRAHLRQKGIADSLCRRALDAIDLDEYHQRASELIAHKWDEVKAEGDYDRKSKVYRYMAQKGYESSIVTEIFSDRQRGS